MGRSGLRVDMDLGLSVLLEAVDFSGIHRGFVQGRDAQLWTPEQLLRAIFRWGLVSRWWDEVVARWPMCYFGMLTAALYYLGQYLSSAQRTELRRDFDERCAPAPPTPHLCC